MEINEISVSANDNLYGMQQCQDKSKLQSIDYPTSY